MTKVGDWAIAPLPSYGTDEQYFEDNIEKVRGRNKFLQSLPMVQGRQTNVNEMENAIIFNDFENGNGLVQGVMNAYTASGQAMAEGYSRGMLARNDARDRLMANLGMGEYRDLTHMEYQQKFGDTALDMSKEDYNTLAYWSNKSGWNASRAVDIFTGERIPLLDNFSISPDEVLAKPAPKGWTPTQALQLLKEKDLDTYTKYAGALGGEEELEKIVDEARNPADFFAKINTEIQMNAITRSMEVWGNNVSTGEYVLLQSKNFIVDGIINDPDMLASTALSLGLASVTGGLSVVGGVIYGGARILSNINKGAKALKRMDQIIEGTSRSGRIAAGFAEAGRRVNVAQRYLPENLGPTLIKTTIFKDRYNQFGTAGKILANRVSDMGEGLITGSGAELMNQWHRTHYGTQADFDFGGVVSEGLVEAFISPALNPMMGGAFKALGGLASLPGTGIAALGSKLGVDESFKPVSNFLREALEYTNPDKLIKHIQINELNNDVGSLMRAALGETYNENSDDPHDPLKGDMFTVLFNSMVDESGLSKTTVVNQLKDILIDIAEVNSDTFGKFSPGNLMAEISTRLVEQNKTHMESKFGNGDKALQQMLGWNQWHVTTLEKAKEANMSYEQYVQETFKNNPEEFLPDDLLNQVKEEMGDAYAESDYEAKIAVAEKLAQRTVAEHNETLVKLKNNTNKNSTAIKEARSEYDNSTDSSDKASKEFTDKLDGISEGEPKDSGSPIEETTALGEQAIQGLEITSEERKQIDKDIKANEEAQATATPKQKIKLEKANEKLNRRKESVKQLENRLEKIKSQIEADFAEATGDVPSEWKEDYLKIREKMKEAQEKVTQALEGINNIKDAQGNSILTNKEIAEFLQDTLLVRSTLVKLLQEASSEDSDTDVTNKALSEMKSVKIDTKDIPKEVQDSIRRIQQKIDKTGHKLKKGQILLLKDLIDFFDGKNTEQSTINGSQVELISGASMLRLTTEQDKKLKSHPEWKNTKKLHEEAEAAFKEYKIIMSKVYKTQALGHYAVLKTVQTQAAAMRERKKQRLQLTNAVEQMREFKRKLREDEVDTMTIGELYELLPDRSQWKINKSAEFKENEGGEYGEVTDEARAEKISIKEADVIFNREKSAVKYRIDQIRPGTIEDSVFPVRFGHLRPIYQQNVSDDAMLGVRRSGATIVQNRTDGSVETVTKTTKEDGSTAEELEQYLAAELDRLETFNRTELSAEIKRMKEEKGITVKAARDNATTRKRINEAERKHIMERMEKEADSLSEEDVLFQAADDREKAALVRTLENDVRAWQEFVSNLKQIALMADKTNNSVAVQRVLAAMPDYFWTLGMGVHVAFGPENILGRANTAIVGNPQQNTTHPSPLIRTEEAHTFRYDVDKLIAIAEAWRDRGLASLQGWQRTSLDVIMKGNRDHVNIEGKEDTSYNLFQTESLLAHIESALRPYNIELYTKQGFILKTDEETGFPISYSKEVANATEEQQEQAYINSVMTAVDKRLSFYINNRKFNEVANIGKHFGIVLDLGMNDGKINKNEFYEAIRTRLTEIDERFEIVNFGNGKVDYAAPQVAGEAIVDFLTGKEMPTRRPLEGVENTETMGHEERLHEMNGESVRVVQPVEGELNAAAPIAPWTIMELVENRKLRKRIGFVLGKTDFTQQEMENFKLWRETDYKEKLKTWTADPVDAEAGVFMFPHIVNGSLDTRIIQRDTMKQYAMELLLDIPRFAQSFIHDQITVSKGTPMSFRTDKIQIINLKTGEKFETDPSHFKGGFTDLFGSGEDILVPFNRIGEVLAVSEMSPHWARLPSAVIDQIENIQEKEAAAWAEKNNIDPKDITAQLMISSANSSDRNASGIFEMKLMALASDPDIRVPGTDFTVAEFIEQLRNDMIETMDKNGQDYYVAGGIEIVKALMNKNPRQFSAFREVFEVMKDIKTPEDFQKASQSNPELAKKLKALRALFKVPILRRVYGGGRPSFDKEFNGSMGKGKQAITDIETAFGVTFEEQEINDFGNLLYEYKQRSGHEIGALIDTALGLKAEFKAKALQLLSINQRTHQPQLNAWKDRLNLDKEELSKELRKIETHRRILDEKIVQQAIYTGIDPGDLKAIQKFKDQYKDRIDAATNYLNELEKNTDELVPGSEEHARFNQLLLGQDYNLAMELAYFRAVNIMNSTSYKLAMDNMAAVAEILEFRDFDPEDFLGLEKHAMFHTMLPTATSYRTYNSSSVFNIQGISLERVRRIAEDDQGEFSNFILERKNLLENDSAYTQEHFEKDINTFLEGEDGPDQLGAFDLVEDIFTDERNGLDLDTNEGSMEFRERVDNKLEQMLMRHEMMQLASYGPLPKEVFPEYTAEEDPELFLKDTLEEWQRGTADRHVTLKDEMRAEENMSEVRLKLRNKARGLSNIDVARRDGTNYQYRPYYVREVNEESRHVVTATSNLRGPLAMSPMFKQVSFYNKGIPALQKLHVSNKIAQVLGPIASIEGFREENATSMLQGPDFFGWQQNWDKTDLPQVLPSYVGMFNLDMNNPIDREAAKILRDVNVWARERGIEDMLQDERAYPRFYLIMRQEEIRKAMLENGSKNLNSEEDIVHQRNLWLSELASLTQISRDIKTSTVRGHKLFAEGAAAATVVPPQPGAFYRETFLGTASEENLNGTLIAAPIIRESIEFGNVPAENLIIIRDENGNNITEKFDFNELQLEGRAVQAQDFNKYLAEILYTELIGKELKEIGGKEYSKWANKPERWDELPPDLKKRLIAKAQQNASNFKSITFSGGIEGKVYNANGEELEALKLTLNQTQDESKRGGKDVSRVQRHSLGNLFGILVGGNTNLKGKNVSIAISETAAVTMFALLENSKDLNTISLSAHLQIPLGTKQGDVALRAQTESRKMKDALGYTERQRREDAAVISEALLRIAGDTKLTTVTDPSSHIWGADLKVVDLDHYYSTAEDQGVDTFGASNYSYVESYISPLLKIINELKQSGYDKLPGVSLVKSLERLIEKARSGNQDAVTQVRMLTVMLEAPKRTMDDPVMLALIGVSSRSEAKQATDANFSKAKNLRYAIRETVGNHGEIINSPLYWDARSFFMEQDLSEARIQNATKDLDAFFDYLERKYPLGWSGQIPQASKLTKEGWAERAYYIALGLETQNIETNEKNNALIPEGIQEVVSRHRSDGFGDKNVIKSSKAFADFADEMGDRDLVRINKNIDDLAKSGIVTEQSTTLLRSVVLKAYMINPAMIENLSFETLTRIDNGAEMVRTGNNYVIRIGENLLTDAKLKTDKLGIPLVFAHELAHVGREKFIENNSGEYAEFLSLFYSESGRSFLKKLVTSWHGGIWSTQARQEYDRYIADPEEFIAAYGSFYLLKGESSLEGMDIDEIKTSEAADTIMKKIFAYIYRIMNRLSGVWASHEKSNPDLLKQVNKLMATLYGYNTDLNAKRSPVDHSAESTQTHNWMNRHGEKAEQVNIDVAHEEILALKRQRENLENMPKENQPSTYLQDIRFIQDKLDDFSKTKYGMFNKSVLEHSDGLEGARDKFGSSYNREIVDLNEMLRSSAGSLNFATSNELVSVMQNLIDNLEKVYGTQVVDGVGEFANNTAKAISNLVSKQGDEALRKMGVELTVGKTGANFTWNSPHIIPVLLTTLLNDEITTMSGNYTNTKGQESISRNLAELGRYTDIVSGSYLKINDKFSTVFDKLFGDGVNKGEQSIRFMNAINTLILRKADNDKIDIDLTTGDIGAMIEKMGLDKKDIAEIKTEMEAIASQYHLMLRKHSEAGKDIGEYAGDWETFVPYMLSSTYDSRTVEGSFRDDMSLMIKDRILNELNNNGKIDGLSLYVAGFLPRVDSIDRAKRELLKLKKDNAKMYRYVVEKIITYDYRRKNSGRTDIDGIKDKVEGFTNALNKEDTKELTMSTLRYGITSLYKDLGRGRITWANLAQAGVDINSIKNKYRVVVENDLESNNMTRLNDLSTPENSVVPSGIIHFSKKGTRIAGRDKVADAEELRRLSDFHTTNLMNRAGEGQFFPNDNWVIPPLTEALDNEKVGPHIASNVVLNPVEQLNKFRKGQASEISEKKLMSDTFGLKATYGDVITLFETSLQAATAIRNYNGEEANQDIIDSLSESAGVLRDKHDMVKGISTSLNTAGADGLEKLAMKYGPSMTRIAFGSNLTLATALVEGTYSAFIELFGNKNVSGFLDIIVSPLAQLASEERKEVANDLISVIDSMTSSMIPDSDQVYQYETTGKFGRFTKGWGNAMLKPAKHALTSFAVARTVTLRKWIQKNIDNQRLTRLASIIEEKGLPELTSLEGLMREAGFAKWEINAHKQVVVNMLKAGFFEQGNMLALSDMLDTYVAKDRRYYDTGMLHKELTRRESKIGQVSTESKSNYDLHLKLINGLHTIETAYSRETIVTPNEFDTATPSGGAMDYLFEIFRRFPMLFVSQHLFRKSSRIDPMRYSFGLIGMLMLDVLYMNLLRVAQGDKVEDIIEDWGKHPLQNAGFYMSRLPVMGRYLGIISEIGFPLVQGLMTGKYNQRVTGPSVIPFAAAASVGSNFIRTISSLVHQDDNPHQGVNMIALSRYLPYVGDTLIRIGGFAGQEFLGNEQQLNRRKYRSIGVGGESSRGGRSSTPTTYYGVSTLDAYDTYEARTAELVNYLTPFNKLDIGRKNTMRDLSLPMTNPAPPAQTPSPAQTQVSPPAQRPSQPATKVSTAVDPVSALGSMKPAEAPIDALKKL